MQNTALTEALTKAHQTAQLLTADIRDAHKATCDCETPSERIANTYLLQLIQQAAELELKLNAIRP